MSVRPHSQLLQPVIDATGRLFVPADSSIEPRRLVSLVPSITEWLFAVGLGERVVGVTRFCEEPADAVAGLPKVGGTKDPDLRAIAALHPDLVIASTEENREVDIEALRTSGLVVFVTHYPTVLAAVDGLELLATLLHACDEADGMVAASRRAIAAAEASIAEPMPYFCPIWRRPYMVARRDTYMADLLALAGGRSALPDDGPAHYFAVDETMIKTAAPMVILLPDEPYRFRERHRLELQKLMDMRDKSVQQVHLVDGKALTWYGPRTLPALRYFTELFDAARTSVTTTNSHNAVR